MNFSNERIVAGLTGMALADAVGNKYEFLSKSEFTPDDILNTKDYGVLNYTDDTQMTLFGFESILNGNIDLTQSYLEWWKTQIGTPPRTNEFPKLISFFELYAQEAPGMTCMQSLKEIYLTGTRQPNNSKGCGSIMRILPFAFVDFNLDVVFNSIKITHDHPENFEAAKLLIQAYQNVNEVDIGLGSVESYGTGWTALECVKMAIRAVQFSTTFNEMLIQSIHHSGDSDSVAAVAGSIWGLNSYPIPDSFYRVSKPTPIDFIIQKILNYKHQ